MNIPIVEIWIFSRITQITRHTSHTLCYSDGIFIHVFRFLNNNAIIFSPDFTRKDFTKPTLKLRRLRRGWTLVGGGVRGRYRAWPRWHQGEQGGGAWRKGGGRALRGGGGSSVACILWRENHHHGFLVITTSNKLYLMALGSTSQVCTLSCPSPLGDFSAGLYGDFNICLLFNFDPITSYLLGKHLTFQLFSHLRHKDFVIFSPK